MELEPPLDRLVRAPVVLIGGATHGTDEFHRERTDLTRTLIARAGVRAVAIEASWAEAERVDRYVRGDGGDRSAERALGDLRRFPAWMWRNAVIEEFVAWLRGHNDALPPDAPRVGVYGIDIHDPETEAPMTPAQDDRGQEAGGRLAAERRRRAALAGAEYRRWLPHSAVHAANVRAQHMADALSVVREHAARGREPAPVVAWAHNGHVGDARATELARRGERSLGQLIRLRAGADTELVGLTTYRGTLTAARAWEEPAEEMPLRPARRGSYEHLLHRQGLRRQVLEPAGLPARRLERAIGGVYRPPGESSAHYFDARIGGQFDIVIHIDETHAVEPLA
jgi:erythromycin esterase-like protein